MTHGSAVKARVTNRASPLPPPARRPDQVPRSPGAGTRVKVSPIGSIGTAAVRSDARPGRPGDAAKGSPTFLRSSLRRFPCSNVRVRRSRDATRRSDGVLPCSVEMLPRSCAMLPSSGERLPRSCAMLPSSGEMLPGSCAMLPSSGDASTPQDGAPTSLSARRRRGRRGQECERSVGHVVRRCLRGEDGVHVAEERGRHSAQRVRARSEPPVERPAATGVPVSSARQSRFRS